MTNVYHHVRNFLEQQPVPAKSLEKSSSPNILYTALPKHWRSNKSFQEPFYVVLLTPVPDNTEVTIWAGNDEKPCEEVRNEKAKVHRQVAKFNDLRFVGRSGRGRKFHLTIVIHSSPMMVATVKNVIKVTVDGPRDARIPKQSSCPKRPSDPQTPSLFPPEIMAPAPMPMSMIPPPWWPLPMGPALNPSFFPLISPGPPPPFSAAFWKLHTDSMKTPVKIKAEQENESLNTSTCLSSPSLFITPNSNDRKRRSRSPRDLKPSPMPSLVQNTPDSIPSKRRRTISTTSSTGSSPTIWRPF